MDRESILKFVSEEKAQTAMDVLQANAISIIGLVTAVAVGIVILEKIKSSGAYSNETNTSLDKGKTGLAEYPNWIQVLVIILIASIILQQLGVFKRVT